MATTKILARKGGLQAGINYVLNGEKTEEQILTATHLCGKDDAYEQMMKVKQKYHKADGVQCYHIIQSYKPGEIEPELALEIAHQFVQEHLPEYQAVIGVHIDKHHVHSHIIFNSVREDGKGKYHSNAQSYYTQIRVISDRLCREHGLSVIMTAENSKAISYVEWLRQSKGQPTYRSMLEADLQEAIEDANDIGNFYMLMESKGYEIKHGNRLGFRFRGEEHFMYPERRNSRYSEDGIRAAIAGNLAEIDAGNRPIYIIRQPYVPPPKREQVKHKGFIALCYYYMYLLGSIEKRQYPPRMTPQLRKDLMQFEKVKAQFYFLRDNGITCRPELDAYVAKQEEAIKARSKQRTILNVRKKKYQSLFSALADAEALLPAKQLHENGHTGVEEEFSRYMSAVKVLEESSMTREEIGALKSDLYTQLADLNREICLHRKNIKMCEETLASVPKMEQQIKHIEQKEVTRHESRQR